MLGIISSEKPVSFMLLVFFDRRRLAAAVSAMSGSERKDQSLETELLRKIQCHCVLR